VPLLRTASVAAPGLSPGGPILDVDQRAVVEHVGGPLLVLAGPGTGKTTTLVEAVAQRLETARLASDSVGIDAQIAGSVLMLTFGRNAADEMRARLAARLGDAVLPKIATFHSFANSLVHEFADPMAFAGGVRLLSGPQQEGRVRELLGAAVASGRLPWPKDLDPAVGTRGLAAEIRLLIAKAQSLEFGQEQLQAAGRASDLPAWIAIGQFLAEYYDVLDAEGVMDYGQLVNQAAALAHSPQFRNKLATRYSHIYVDEYQDTDPSQVRLLQALRTPATTLVAVGDPDQAIYRFRGAEVGGILAFPQEFATADGQDAPIAVLGNTRRFGPLIRDAAGRVIRRVSLGTLPSQIQRAHRVPHCQPDMAGRVDLLTFDSIMGQAHSVADVIRRARLQGNLGAWSDAAVLVRSAARDLPPLQQALIAAGVPVVVPSQDSGVRANPAVRVLLDVVRAAVQLNEGSDRPSADEADSEPDSEPAIGGHHAIELLTSPIGGLGPADIRRLGRALRRAHRVQAGTAVCTESATDLIAGALADPGLLLDFTEPEFDRVREMGALLLRVSRAIEGGRSIAELLWLAWSATSWPQRLERAALGRTAEAIGANRDLDAVVELFELARRDDQVFDGRRGIANFLDDLDSQDLSGRATKAPPGRDAVTLMTAHSAKGQQWPLVVIAGVQEGRWPDLRMRATVLGADRLSSDGLGEEPSVGERIDDERRLFFVACTRAQQHLVVTAVADLGDGGETPSRFLDEIAGVEGVTRSHQRHRPGSSLSTQDLVARLRAVGESPEASPALREQAAVRLAQLADDGVRQARPNTWWGLRERTQSVQPVRDPDAPLRISGSAWTSIEGCSLAWFLDREARGSARKGAAGAFGSVVHALADAVARGELPDDHEELSQRAAQVWSALPYEAGWQASAELREATAALTRFVNWHSGRPGRKVVGTEVDFSHELQLDNDQVVVRGSIDRLEVDLDGQIHIIDLKTQRKAPTAAQIAEHRQLQLYQEVVADGAVAGSGFAVPTENVAGAELVQLRLQAPANKSAPSVDMPKVQAQGAVDSAEVRESLAKAVEVVRSERFSPNPSDGRCRTCEFRAVCPSQDLGEEVGS